ncbi:hypothetical protein WMF39_47475 [Sorangium sp. So ce1504]|uniref:monooxygenase n=1 Tax=Sorangium sp. So ce1504 TaxID=3133337 RepID=UPI003F61B382
MRLLIHFVLPSATALLLGCSAEAAPGASTPTFHRDIEPLLQKSCLGCHAQGGTAPVSLASYESAKALAPVIADETEARRMPPWGALPTDECAPPRPFRGDLHLSLDEIALLRAWSDAGAPEGDPADAPAPTTPVAAGLSRTDLELSPKAPFAAAEGSDSFRCFVLDPGLTEQAWVQGYDVLPGNRAVVHHALLFIDAKREGEALGGESGSYECFGDARLSETSLLGAWAPGTQAFELPPDIGISVPANALLVMQVHYHPKPGEAPSPDATRVALRLADEKPSRALSNLALGNAEAPFRDGTGLLPGPGDRGSVEFRIPAGARGHVERMRYVIDFPIPEISIYGAGVHMHRAGVDLKVDQIRAEPRGGEANRACLVQTPAWDYNWQRLYSYDAPIDELPTLRSGDTIELRCTYDNTTENPALAAQLIEERLPAPQDIVLGESTLDEMCVAFLPVVHPNL